MSSDLLKKAILSSFVADSHALSGHWCYDTLNILTHFGKEELHQHLLPPTLNDYHKGKTAGELTHYGDQMLWLLNVCSEEKKKHLDRLDVEEFWQNWLEHMITYKGYHDHATLDTLDEYEHEKPKHHGSNSIDIAGAVRCVPLLLQEKDEESFASDAAKQAAITHDHPLVLACADIFARTLWRVLKTKALPSDVFAQLIQEKSYPAPIPELVSKALTLADEFDPENDENDESIVISFGASRDFQDKTVHLGKSCSALNALPAIVYFVAKYEDNSLEEAIVNNTIVGGDSAARGIMIGAILGCMESCELPDKWVKEFKYASKINELLE